MGEKLNEAVKRADEVIQLAREYVQNLSAPNERRMILAGAAWVLSLEHHRAITLLIKEGLYGSAMAIRRTQYEAYVSGMWLMHDAVDDQIQQYLAGRYRPSLSALDRAVREKIGFSNGSGDKEWLKELHDYAHAGASAVAQQLGPDGIQPRYSESGLVHVLDMGSALAAAAIIDIVGHATRDQEIIENIQNRLLKILSKAP